MSKAQMRALREEEDRLMMAKMAALAASELEESSEEETAPVAAAAATGVASTAAKKKKKKRKPKKKAAELFVPVVAAAPPAPVEAVARAPAPAAAKKKAPVAKPKKSPAAEKERSKKSERKLKDEQLDKLLSEFGLRPIETTEAKARESKQKEKKDVLQVDLSKLDYRQDLKALFGTAVAKSLIKKQRSGGEKTWMARCDEGWPRPRALLTLKVLGRQADDGAVVYGLEWTPQYAAAEADFLDAVASNQPNFLVLVIQRYGFHSGALLQLATLSQKSGQFEQAADLLERSVYFFEHCIGATFRLDDPLVRMPHAHRENQALYVTMFKWSSMLGRKGCCRAALECCKLMLSWDRTDPLDFLLMVDWLALRCEEFDFLIELRKEGFGIKQLSYYPNLSYGLAFALLERKRVAEARAAMLEALLLFPECAISILGALGVACDWKRSSWFSQFGETSSNTQLQRAMSVYCSRSKDLWRSRVLQEFVASVASELAAGSLPIESERAQMLEMYERDDSGFQLPCLVRHMMLSEEEFENAAQIPAAMLQEALNLDALNAPPPANSEIALARLMGSEAEMPSIEEQIEQIRRAPTANAVALFLHSLLPWNNPNAPPEAVDEATLVEQARALLGMAPAGALRQGGGDDSDGEDDLEDEVARNNAADEDSNTDD